MTKIGEKLLSHFSPQFNKKGEMLGAIIANDKGSGAVEKMMINGDEVMNLYTKTSNIYDFEGDLLDQVLNFFSFFKRFYNELDISLIKRNKSIFIRGGDLTFGTIWNVKHVFEYYFPSSKIYILENMSFSDNLLINDSFESIIEEEINAWNYENSEVDNEDVFSGQKDLLFTAAGGKVSQTVETTKTGPYFLTFFMKGNCSVRILEDGIPLNVWKVGEDPKTVREQTQTFETDDWENVQIFCNSEKEISDITVEITGNNTDTKIDLVNFSKKRDYPVFSVGVWFPDVTQGGSTLHLGRNGEDPIEGVDYTKESYLDNAFFTGVSGKSFADEIYSDILNQIKAAGTKGEVRLLLRESK